MNGLGGEANEVALIADELSRAVELTLNPAVAHEARSQAYNACESFKENSPWCAQAGLLLASGNQYSAVVRHFGLQLMEHTVKYRWTQITQAEKIFIKENAMKLLYMGGWDVGHLNDALARVIVEMVKREWPQQWPTLLAELSDACARGHMHTQIVLHVFLRLVEDVATLQTLEQHQRRKDIYQALTANMAEIFAFFMRLIELHVQQFREHSAAGDMAGAASNGRVVQVCKRKSKTAGHNHVKTILYKSNFSNDDTRFGQKYENTAIKMFEQESGKKINSAGLFIDVEHGFLGASPDGIVEDEDSIVEVKCFPSLARSSKSLEDAAKTKRDFPLTYSGDGDIHLKKNHNFYYQVVLLTLTGFVEWVSINHVVTNNGRLLQILCILLEDDAFRLPAAECLLQIVNRKGSTKERKPLMILFSADAVGCIHRAALAASQQDEKHYLFLKKLSQVIAGLGQQLTSMWTYATDCEAWLPGLLETMLLLTSHPSLTLAHTVNSVWLALFKLEQRALLGKMPNFLAVVPRWLQAAAPKVLKVTYPASRASGVSDAVAYAIMDYDSDQEFAIFFARCRTEILESFRHCMCIAPQMTWLYVEQWTGSALDKVDSCPPEVDTSHPLYLEWEALSMVLDVVLSRLLVSEPRPDAASGLSLLQRCVNCTPRAAELQSLLLSLISALFVFLSCACSQLAGPQVGSAGAELLPRVLDKIFAALVSSEGTEPRSRAVKNTRRHAASLLVKLASKYPLLLLPVFGRLHAAARAALARPDLSAVESVTLQEAILLVSNHLCCYERQSALVAQVLGDCSERWAALGPHLASAETLSRLIGLDQPPSSAEDECGRARRTLLHALTLLLGVVKRTQVPDDPDKASRGGFNGGVTPAGNPIWRNPCAAHVLPLLPHVLSLARALHELHAPAAPAARHPLHARALKLPVAEHHNLLGLRDHDATPAGPQDRMQNFLHTLHDNVCHLIGSAASSLGRELYSMTGLATALTGSLLGGLEYLPDHWLRPIVRSALKPLLHHCPPASYRDVAVPVCEHVSMFMLSHLSRRWDYIDSLYSSGKLEEDSATDAQEVLEDMLVRHLTREYLEALKISLVGGGLGVSESSGDMEEDSPAAPARTPEQVSELGAILLIHSPAILHTIFRSLTWNDSTASLRACALVMPATRSLLEAGRLGAAEASGGLAALLAALRQHGQHDSNQHALLHTAVQLYEALRPVFPGVAAVLRAIPDVDAHDLHRLDEKLSAARGKPAKTDKSKRELFKKITARLIGRNVGQLFKKEVFIMDLPTMPTAPKDKPRSTVDSPEGANLEGLFASRAPT